MESVRAEIGTPAQIVKKRRDLVDAGLADWKIHFELAVLNQRLRNPSAVYYHLNRILELYPHNRETYMKLAEVMSRDGKWSEVIPNLERSLHYTRGDEEKIAETIGWLGTANFRMGEYEKATGLLLRLTKEYPDQIGLVLRAYGNLVKYSRENRKTKDLERHIKDVQRYAESLIRDGKDQEYPLLYKRVSQIMTMGGYTAEAREWAQAAEQ
jgi:tetratricopeptide (TPR) repeat protein